ncbi:MAG: hypothetical protein O0X49_06215 [Methanocorpusculum sp.]|nr:hypothetical protein [Methanocorpusculum sp.]
MDRTGFSFFLIIHFRMNRLEKNSSEHPRSSVTGIKKFTTPKKIFFVCRDEKNIFSVDMQRKNSVKNISDICLRYRIILPGVCRSDIRFASPEREQQNSSFIRFHESGDAHDLLGCGIRVMSVHSSATDAHKQT